MNPISRRGTLLLLTLATLCPIVSPAASQPGRRQEKEEAHQLNQQFGDTQATSEERAQLAEKLWQTPLGQMYHHFLFEMDASESPAELAHAIVDRIHGDVKMTITRQSALNMLRENLFDTSKLTPTVYERLMLLDTGLAIKQQMLQNRASREFLKFFPVFLGIAFIGGSPLVREKLQTLSGDVWNVIKTYVQRKPLMDARRMVMENLNVMDLFDRGKFFKSYSPFAAYLTLWHSFGTSYLIYHVYRTGSADSVAAQNKIWVYGMQRLVSLDEI